MVKCLYIVKNAYLILGSFMLTCVLLTLVLIFIKGKLILYNKINKINKMSCLIVKIFIE
ncbi:hypothetical protein BOFE_08880 (plasmid) [Candidatus Borrelia fainii]|uniref:Uncharacterized protein n=1 Tax=Candidatus Borrelia fainii TaxID=2518322 RepID=A0ABM8DL71_9SPIR|nr:hypothetical protein BOFE_08880 [Candidatus Borrelia fainii]